MPDSSHLKRTRARRALGYHLLAIPAGLHVYSFTASFLYGSETNEEFGEKIVDEPIKTWKGKDEAAKEAEEAAKELAEKKAKEAEESKPKPGVYVPGQGPPVASYFLLLTTNVGGPRGLPLTRGFEYAFLGI